MRQLIEKEPDFRGVTLFIDDIRDIVRVIEDAKATVTISDGEYTYDNVDDLLKHRNTVKELTITGVVEEGSHSHTHLSIRTGINGHVRFGRWGEKKLFAGIPTILNAKRRSFHWLAEVPFSRLPTICALILVLIITITCNWFHHFGTGLLLAACVIVAQSLYGLLGWLSAVVACGGFSQIFLTQEHEKPVPFFRKHANSIVIFVAGAIFGGFFSEVGKWLFVKAIEPASVVSPTPGKAPAPAITNRDITTPGRAH